MTIGIIGLGSVGSVFAVEFQKKGATVKGYDVRVNDREMQNYFVALREKHVNICASIEQLVTGCDCILSLTNSTVAVDVARQCNHFLVPDQFYVDMNSCVPASMEEIDSFIKCKFIDGMTLFSNPEKGLESECYFSGQYAKEAGAILAKYGLNVVCVGSKAGQASACKVLRSIFTKSFEAAIMESLTSSYYYGVYNFMIDSICKFLSQDILNTVDFVIRSNVVHAARRAHEVGDVSEMIAEAGLDNTMSCAAADKLRSLSLLDRKGALTHELAKDKESAIKDTLNSYLNKRN